MASILPSLNREDRALAAWYPSLYAPRTGGAYDSHHRTAGIAGCTRRRGGGVAARGARAAGGAADDWVHTCQHARKERSVRGGISPRLKRDRLRREAEHHDRIPLGGARALRSTSSTGGRSGAPKGECDRSDYCAGSPRRQSCDRQHSYRLRDRGRPDPAWSGGEPEPAGRQHNRRDPIEFRVAVETTWAIARFATRGCGYRIPRKPDLSGSRVARERPAGRSAHARAADACPECRHGGRNQHGVCELRETPSWRTLRRGRPLRRARRTIRDAGGAPCAAYVLSVSRVRRGWRSHQLRSEPHRFLSSSRRLYWPNPQGREAGRPARFAADQVRAGDQSQDRQGAWPDNSAGRARDRRRGDRMSAPAASWCDPAGGSPAQVRSSVRLVASVARPLATVVAKRTQRLHGVWD